LRAQEDYEANVRQVVWLEQYERRMATSAARERHWERKLAEVKRLSELETAGLRAVIQSHQADQAARANQIELQRQVQDLVEKKTLLETQVRIRDRDIEQYRLQIDELHTRLGRQDAAPAARRQLDMCATCTANRKSVALGCGHMTYCLPCFGRALDTSRDGAMACPQCHVASINATCILH
jgi:hypothetical protein